MEYGQTAVFGGRRGDQGVGRRNPVVAVTACGELAEGTHGRVRHGAIVAQDPQRVELDLQREMFGAGTSGVENFHPHDRRDPEPVVANGLLQHRAKLAWQREYPPPRGCVRNERRVATKEFNGVHAGGLLEIAGELLDLRQRAAIEPVRAADAPRGAAGA